MAAVMIGRSAPNVVEVLPENYSVVTSVSDELCTGPSGRTNIVRSRTRTQTVDLNK